MWGLYPPQFTDQPILYCYHFRLRGVITYLDSEWVLFLPGWPQTSFILVNLQLWAFVWTPDERAYLDSRLVFFFLYSRLRVSHYTRDDMCLIRLETSFSLDSRQFFSLDSRKLFSLYLRRVGLGAGIEPASFSRTVYCFTTTPPQLIRLLNVELTQVWNVFMCVLQLMLQHVLHLPMFSLL